MFEFTKKLNYIKSFSCISFALIQELSLSDYLLVRKKSYKIFSIHAPCTWQNLQSQVLPLDLDGKEFITLYI